jgi:hydroxyacylglutathione hydrolase
MGSAYLAKRASAQVVNGEHDLFGHGHLRLGDGGSFRLGSLTLRALHTPGHTLESMCYAVYTAEDAPDPWCVFTGDTLFFGTTGRTDLSDADQSVASAALLYESVHAKLAGLSDTTLVFPAHGPGSVCGSGMADRPYSTIGEEKRSNHVFTLGRNDFAAKKGGERLPRPPYFRHMEKVNLAGGKPPGLRAGDVPLLGVDAFAASSHGKLVFDTREPEGFAGGHAAGSYSIWLGGLPVVGGWIADANSPVYLMTDRNEDVDTAALHLTRIGIDNVNGGLAGGFGKWRGAGRPIEHSGVITPRELAADRARYQVLDVRETDEYDAGHIPGARNLSVGYLRDRIDALELDRARPTVVTCSIGHRSGLGVSVLERAGFRDARNLLGGMTAWKALELPIE